MKLSVCMAALAVALCLGSSLVAANDLTVTAAVLDCNDKPVPGAVVLISGCVDDFLEPTGGISATTNGTGVAAFLKGQENSIQYCYGSAGSCCTFEVLSPLGLTYSTQNLLSPGNGSQVTAKGFICEIYDCCNPCNPTKQEASCVSPLAGPRLEFKPTLESCPTLPPPVDVGGETCFGWFKPTYNGDQVLDEVRVTSASFRADQKNDATNVLTSGAFSLSATPDAPFLYLGNSQGNVRWGWEQLWNLPTGGAAFTEAGSMYCGQNKLGGNIVATVTATSITYEITMSPGTKFEVGDIHVYASCTAISGRNFTPGRLNCNPSNPSGCTTSGQLLANGSQYKGTIMFGGCPDGQLFTVFHLGL